MCHDKITFRIAVLGLFIAFMMVLAMCFAIAKADTNLAAQCKAGTSSGSKTCTGGVIYDYPATNRWIRTTGDVFYFWDVLSSTSLVSVCAADIPRASSACPVINLIPKSQVPLKAPPAATTMKVQITWVAPTTGLQDGKTVALQSGDIVSYQIAWVPKAGGRGGEFSVPATQTTYQIEIPAQAAVISMSVQGKDSWGGSSVGILVDPKAAPAVVPNAPSDVRAEVVP